MIDYKGGNLHLKLLSKDDEMTEELFNIVVNSGGVVAMKEFLTSYTTSYYHGIIRQFSAWVLCSNELFDECRLDVQRRHDYYVDTWRFDKTKVIELLCSERVTDVLDVIYSYEKLLWMAPSVLRALIFALKACPNEEGTFMDACLVRIETLKSIFKRLGIK